MEFPVSENNIIEWLEEGKDYSEIRNILVKKGYDDKEIKIFMKIVDEEHLKHASKKQTISRSLSLILMGIVLLVVGLGISIYSYTKGSSSFIVEYGATLSGIGFIIKGCKERGKENGGITLFKRKDNDY